MDLSDRVVAMAGVVDAGAFDHEEESFFAVLGGGAECIQGGLRHFVEGGVDVVLLPAVDFVGDICAGEEAQKGKLCRVPEVKAVETGAVGNVGEVLLFGEGDDVFGILAAGVRSGVGEKVAAAAAEKEIGDAAEGVVADFLFCNAVFFFAFVDVRCEAGGCGVCDSCGDD